MIAIIKMIIIKTIVKIAMIMIMIILITITSIGNSSNEQR